MVSTNEQLEDCDPVLPFQRADAVWISETGNAYLAHQMRVGKTAPAIRACDLLGARRVLWLTTGAARRSHAMAWETYSPLGHNIQVVLGGGEPITGDVVITSYYLATKELLTRLLKRRWDVLVLDEAHKLKNPEAKRTQAVLGDLCDGVGGLCSRADVGILLSGTPAPNHPGELWPVLRCFFPDAIATRSGEPMSRWQFEAKYCKTKSNDFGRRVVGAKNVAELSRRISPYFRHRTFSETFPDAKGATVDNLYVDAHAQLSALCEDEEDHLIVEMSEALLKTPVDKIGRALDDLDEKVKQRIRRLTGLAKAPGIVEWAKEQLQSGGKVVLMGHHKDVLDTLCRSLSAYNPVRVSGGVSPKAKTEAEQTFLNDPKRRVFVGNILSAGEAIDLSVADQICLVESSWVPGENAQAIRRIVNMHKTRENVAWFATLADSIDVQIQNANIRKAKDLQALMQFV